MRSAHFSAVSWVRACLTAYHRPLLLPNNNINHYLKTISASMGGGSVRPKAWRLRGVFFGGAGSGLFGSVRPFWGGCCIVALCKITNRRRSSPPETPLAFCGFFVQDIQKAYFLRASVTLCCRRRGGGKNYFFNGFLAVAVRFGRSDDRRGVAELLRWVAVRFGRRRGGSVRPKMGGAGRAAAP